jgi:pentapeptide repeat protein
LSNWTIAAGALVVLAVAAVVSLLILRHYGGKEGQVQLDAIRTAGTLVIGTGGAVALLLTARRQRYTELTLVHTSRDATERRITELYTKAAELLGSDQAPVRLAGLYALERLAHSTVEHRQTIVDVICAYLRMPYRPPQQQSYRSPGPARRHRVRPLSDRPASATPTSRGSPQEHSEQELQVRLTAQNILFRNLRLDVWRRLRWWYRTGWYPTWPGIGLNLTGALLVDFSLAHCRLNHADFTRAKFTGRIHFEWAEFLDGASFEGAQFTGEAKFRRAQFADRGGSADFEGAQFTGKADFHSARFTRKADFKFAQFNGGASFRSAQFPLWGSNVLPRWVFFLFGPKVDCYFAENWNSFFHLGGVGPGEADFEGARVDSAAEPDVVWPPGWTTRPSEPNKGEDLAFLYLTKVEDAQDK